MRRSPNFVRNGSLGLFLPLKVFYPVPKSSPLFRWTWYMDCYKNEYTHIHTQTERFSLSFFGQQDAQKSRNRGPYFRDTRIQTDQMMIIYEWRRRKIGRFVGGQSRSSFRKRTVIERWLSSRSFGGGGNIASKLWPSSFIFLPQHEWKGEIVGGCATNGTVHPGERKRREKEAGHLSQEDAKQDQQE